MQFFLLFNTAPPAKSLKTHTQFHFVNNGISGGY